MLESIWEAFKQILAYLSSIFLLLKDVQIIVEKSKIKKSTKAMVSLDKHLYGKYWLLSSDQKSLDHDDEACNKFMNICKSANDIVSEAPFLSLDEEASVSMFLCHFCPLVRVKFISMSESKKGTQTGEKL